MTPVIVGRLDTTEVVLRILHIVAGTFWAGTLFLFALVVVPQVRALGPSVERRFWSGLLRSPLMVALPLAALTNIGAGVALGLRARWDHLDTFFDGGWGWAILVGFVATMANLAVVFVIDNPNGAEMKRLLGAVEGREPDATETQQLARVNGRMAAVVRAEAGLLLVAVGAMAAARFV